MDQIILTLGGFILALALLGIAAVRFGVDSRPTQDERTNW